LRSWKVITLRSDDDDATPLPNMTLEKSIEGKRLAAAIDQKSGWVFIAGEKGLRA